MRIVDDRLILSPTDLADFLACRHKTTLELDAVRGLRARPTYSDPLADTLRQRGQEHERRYVDSLRAKGLHVEDLTSTKEPGIAAEGRVAKTLDAMRRGVDVVVQAPLGNEGWGGYADVLVRVPVPSDLGDWSYEAHDTKLARETRAGAILQLCIYSELLGEMQGRTPAHFFVVTPAATHTYRFDEVAAYFRLVKAKLQSYVTGAAKATSYVQDDTGGLVGRGFRRAWEVRVERRWRIDRGDRYFRRDRFRGADDWPAALTGSPPWVQPGLHRAESERHPTNVFET